MAIDERELQQRFKDIPDELAVALTSPELVESIDRVARNYNLNQEDTSHLELLVTLTFLGERHIENFKEEVEGILDIPEDIADSIAEDLNAAIFANYVAELQEVGDTYYNRAPESVTDAVPQKPEAFPYTDASTEPKLTIPAAKSTQSEETSSIKNHILDEIENPRPSPLVSVPQYAPQYTPQNTPIARQAPLSPKPDLPKIIPSGPVKPFDFPTARVIPPLVNRPEKAPSPFLVAKKPETVVPPLTPDTHPAIPEHTEEELMPLIIKTSQEAQADGTHAQVNTNSDPYREPPVA